MSNELLILDGFKQAAIAEIIQCEKEIVCAELDLHTSEQKAQQLKKTIQKKDNDVKYECFYEMRLSALQKYSSQELEIKNKIKHLRATINFLQNKYLT